MAPTEPIPFSDLALSRRLERAEGFACAMFAEAQRHLRPDCGSEWMECAGARCVFNGIESPVTQSFGLGIFEEASAPALDSMERFFLLRATSVVHEVSPFAGVGVLDLLCKRNYRPIELSNVLYRPLAETDPETVSDVDVHRIASGETEVWNDINARGWTHDHPELLDTLSQFGAVISACDHSTCFLARVQGKPGAAGVLWLSEGIALCGGSATVPELRRHGLQAALLEERLRYAFSHGCDIAMMVAEAGSNSQRNAERKGFRIAYTRTKWRLAIEDM